MGASPYLSDTCIGFHCRATSAVVKKIIVFRKLTVH
jgi:hypothetical protein